MHLANQKQTPLSLCFNLDHTQSQILPYKDYFLIIEVWAPHQYSANQFWIPTSDRKRPKCRLGKQKKRGGTKIKSLVIKLQSR